MSWFLIGLAIWITAGVTIGILWIGIVVMWDWWLQR